MGAPGMWRGALSPAERGPERAALLGFAGAGVPLRRVRFLLEVRARDERLREVLRVVDDRRDREPVVAVALGMPVEVLRDDRVLAVRHAVLAKVTFLQACRHDF